MKFTDLNLNSPLLNALEDKGYHQPTTIQAKAFAVVMSGADMVGIAQTGTGKTLAYLLPCLRLWSYDKSPHPTILVLVPTRELVQQVVAEAESMTGYMNFTTIGVYGGANINVQSEKVRGGCDLVVGTPGRLMDLVLNGSIKTKHLKKLVIDEMDEMLNLGFRHQILNVFDLIPTKRQNMLFSATLESEVEGFVKTLFSNTKVVEAAPSGTPLEEIEQLAYNVPNFHTKLNLLNHLLLSDESMNKVLVFISGKKLADKIHEGLDPQLQEQFSVIHSNKSQNKRFAAVNDFKNGSVRGLIATDIIARGLDVEGVSHVINFAFHSIPETYVHRIGRTGRAGKKGIAISFITEKATEMKEKIEEMMRYKIPMVAFPEEVELSDIMASHEMPVIDMPKLNVKLPSRESTGPAFHEKIDKNKKVNIRKSRSDVMRAKYKKPQKRQQKKKR